MMSEPQSRSPRQVDPSTWVDQYGDTLYRYVLMRLRDPDAAEEVVQETFLAALRHSEQYAGRGDEGAWLMGICKRKLIEFVRRRSREAQLADDESGGDPSAALFDEKGRWRFDPRFARGRPEAALERNEFWKILRRCLEGLPTRQADAFTLREIEAMDRDDICKELEITPSNLWVLLHRARLKLTGCLKSHLEPTEAH